jgi:L-2,4-diaminobutyrate decarboxylase
VVASACSTATGSFDPIAPIAEFCRERDLWLHVDGAHGASYALSPKLRHRLEGIERADSVVWDLHKLLALPALNTAVLFREGQRSYSAFAQEASYLFEGETTREEWFNVGRRTLECTKRGLGLVAYATLQAVGTDALVEHLERTYARTLELHDLLRDAEDFEVAHRPQANILCFRYAPAGCADLDALQARVRAAVLAGGSHYLVQTRLEGALWLRVTLMNPFTDRGALLGLLQAIRTAA